MNPPPDVNELTLCINELRSILTRAHPTPYAIRLKGGGNARDLGIFNADNQLIAEVYEQTERDVKDFGMALATAELYTTGTNALPRVLDALEYFMRHHPAQEQPQCSMSSPSDKSSNLSSTQFSSPSRSPP